MAKIILNVDYVESDDVKKTGKYLFDAEDGSDTVPLTVWLEKSKANDKHPDGKPWIRLPKGNITNREYFSEDLFHATAVDGEVTVEVKTSAPRVLGATGVKQEVIKYLSPEEAAEYTDLVNGAVEKYKATKSNDKKKPEDMTIEELEAYIDALKNNKPYVVEGPKTFIECFTEDEYNRYNELLAIATENKANAPKAQRRPLTDEEKAARKVKRNAKALTAAKALLAKLRGETSTDAE